MKRVAIAVLLVIAPMFFALGATMPLVTFEKLIFFSENPSLLAIVSSLFDNGDHALALLVGLVSLVFPIFKMAAVAYEAAWIAPANRSLIARLIPLLGKWSMMDVLLVAIVIAAAKTSGLAQAFSEAGLWFYAGSAICVSILQWLVSAKPSA